MEGSSLDSGNDIKGKWLWESIENVAGCVETPLGKWGKLHHRALQGPGQGTTIYFGKKEPQKYSRREEVRCM